MNKKITYAAIITSTLCIAYLSWYIFGLFNNTPTIVCPQDPQCYSWRQIPNLQLSQEFTDRIVRYMSHSSSTYPFVFNQSPTTGVLNQDIFAAYIANPNTNAEENFNFRELYTNSKTGEYCVNALYAQPTNVNQTAIFNTYASAIFVSSCDYMPDQQQLIQTYIDNYASSQ